MTLEIRWDSDAATGGLNCVRSAQGEMDACLVLSNAAMEALVDARPTGDDKAVNKLIEKMETTIRHLRINAEAMEAIAGGLEDAILRYEEAEETVGRRIDQLFTGTGTEGMATSGSARGRHSGAMAEAWIPQPLILPIGNDRERMIPGWLEAYLGDPAQFANWME